MKVEKKRKGKDVAASPKKRGRDEESAPPITPAKTKAKKQAKSAAATATTVADENVTPADGADAGNEPIEHIATVEARARNASAGSGKGAKSKKGAKGAKGGATGSSGTGEGENTSAEGGDNSSGGSVMHTFTPEQLQRTVFVGNVPPNVQHKLQKALSEHFSKCAALSPY